MKSQREDGRGHWPKGKRRHEDKGDWSVLRRSLTQFLGTYYSRGEVSMRQLAADLNYSTRAVRRWLHGEDRPTIEVQEAIEQWLAEWRAEMKRRSR